MFLWKLEVKYNEHSLTYLDKENPMKEIFCDLLTNIPDYDVFLTADELDASSIDLARRFPETVKLFSIGQTRQGKDLLCLQIGEGERNALMFGCPHPNEPIGTMMLEYFSEELAKSRALRKELGYSWYIVKAWDRDGLTLNEPWLKGPFTLYNYSRNFFRPAGHRQVDWTFPVHYKDFEFKESIPETRAMMRLIDEIRPEFIYSLHNSGFGGVYWYITHPLKKSSYVKMRRAAERVNIPLHLGEPELPYLNELAQATYSNLSLKAEYDYLEKYGAENIGNLIRIGDCSASYAKERHNSFTLLTELPYFYDERIKDQSVTDRLRKDVVLDSMEYGAKSRAYIQSILRETRLLTGEENPFRVALEAFSGNGREESTKRMLAQNPDYNRPASLAECFDNLHLSKFYSSLSYGMAIRLCEYELDRENLAEEARQALEGIRLKAMEAHRALLDELEQELNYEAIPIRQLISIQLECGLVVCEELKERQGEQR